jgi:D-alanyl-D-alanine carboxypeptidase/D-alanyl-D-alanine-endopeptidase (penicillin-binding protein 4)
MRFFCPVQVLLRLVCLLMVTLAFQTAVAQESVPPVVGNALRAAGIPLSSVGIAIQEIGSSKFLLTSNAATALNPASTVKLVTTYAGLELLGPAFRWKTETYLGGPLRDGILEGDLTLKGYGDPKLTLEALWLLLRDLRARGLKDIRGDLVLDRTQFAPVEFDVSRFDGDALRPYNVGPDALLINFKAVRFHFLPEPERRGVRVFAEPRIVDVASDLRLADTPCGDWRERMKADFQAQSSMPKAAFSGSYSVNCGERDWHVAMLTPNQYAAGLFRLLWAELGGTVGGTAGGTAREGIAPQGKPFASLESPTLSEVVRDINKFSNNVMARQLFLTIAAEQAGAPATTANAQRAIKAWLAKKGLDFPELVMENGSGLSRIERISAQSLTSLLVAAFRSPVMPELVASLPLIAVDGTMRKRMKSESIAGQAHIKTGSLSDVRAIAGYVLDRSGRRYAVTMIVNHPNAQQSQAAQDGLLNWVYSR